MAEKSCFCFQFNDILVSLWPGVTPLSVNIAVRQTSFGLFYANGIIIAGREKPQYNQGVVMKNDLAIFEEYKIRRLYDEKTETWFFSVVDIIQALTQQPNYQTARKYWNKLKERLGKEGSETVTNCHQLKMVAEDGKMRVTDAANPETLLRLIQSVPSPKAEPIKLWLARVGYERMQEMADPGKSLERARENWQTCCFRGELFAA